MTERGGTTQNNRGSTLSPSTHGQSEADRRLSGKFNSAQQMIEWND